VVVYEASSEALMKWDSAKVRERCTSWIDRRLRRQVVVAGGEDQKEVDAGVRAVRIQADHPSRNLEHGSLQLFGRRMKARRRRHQCVGGLRESKMQSGRAQ
jgi:hypothetical protein